MRQVQRQWRQVRVCVSEDQRFVRYPSCVRHIAQIVQTIGLSQRRSPERSWRQWRPSHLLISITCRHPSLLEYVCSDRAIVCFVPPAHALQPASDSPRQDLRMFQSYVEDNVTFRTGKTQDQPDESGCNGKLVLRSSVLEGESESLWVYISGIFG